MADKTNITVAVLRQLLEYNAETGVLTWKARPVEMFSNAAAVRSWNTKYAGSRAGRPLPTGHSQVQVLRRMVSAHRIAWALFYGEWPPGEIDHINNNARDNRICNLRIATRTENQRNRRVSPKRGFAFKGVAPHRKKFRAYIQLDRRFKHLGVYDTPEEAHAAYCAAARQHFGEFANAG